MNEHTGAVDNI